MLQFSICKVFKKQSECYGTLAGAVTVGVSRGRGWPSGKTSAVPEPRHMGFLGTNPHGFTVHHASQLLPTNLGNEADGEGQTLSVSP